MDGYMSVMEAAEYLGKSKAEVHRLIRNGVLAAEKVGNSYIIKSDDVERRKQENPGPGNPNFGKGYHRLKSSGE